jgi:hypothetical protein
MAFFVAPNVSLAETNATIEPFFNFVRSATSQPNLVTFSIPFEDFNAWSNFTFSFGTSSDGQDDTNVELASRLLSRDAAEGDRAEETARLLLTLDGVAIKYVSSLLLIFVSSGSTNFLS